MNAASYYSIENQQVINLLAHRLDNSTLDILSRTSIWSSILENNLHSGWFWYLRTQHLVGRELLQTQGDWKTAYYLLEENLGTRNPFTENLLSSLIATSVLLELGYDPTARGNSAIRTASARGHVAVVKLLLADERLDPTASQNGAVRLAAGEGRAEVVKLLLADERVDPTAEDNEAIRSAAENGHTEVVKLLLADERVDPTDQYNYAVRVAAIRGHTEVVKLLLAHGSTLP